MDKDTLDQLMKSYERVRMMELLGEHVMPRITGEARLNRQEKMLSIMAKKRALGLPESSDEYEDAINEPRSFWSQIMPGAARRGLQAIPEPGMGAFKSIPDEWLIAQPRVAHSIADMLPSKVNNITKAGNKYAGIARQFGRAALYL